ncbi:MAG: type IX secretion system membrane protein PorP/SprF [Cyclobacteriaceae bacterium]|nr:type IX secretion system membrane protein PorP/SprF [Cyclobacteriaceae bacterium]
MKYIPYSLVFIVVSSVGVRHVHAQENDFTQYFLNLPVVNAGFTGMNDYLDVRTGLREGWNDFSIKNSNTFLSAYGTLGAGKRSGRRNNSLRISNPGTFNSIQQSNEFRRRLGAGAMISERTVGPYKSFGASLNFAYHLPLSPKLNLSLGTRGSFFNKRIDFTGLQVRDDVNDIFYQNLIASNQGAQNLVNVDFGTVLYSRRFYFGVATSNLVSKKLNGEQLFAVADEARYKAQIGVFLPVSPELSVAPAVVATYAQGYDVKLAASLRVRYKELFYVGGGYEPGSRTSLLVGFNTTNLSIGYAYDIYTAALTNFNANTHELVLGITVLNRYKLKPSFW